MQSSAILSRPLYVSFRWFSLLLVLLAGAYGIYAWDATKREKLDYLRQLSEFTAKSADQFFNHHRSGLEVLGKALQDGNVLEQPERAQELLWRFKNANPEIANVHIFRTDGQILLSTQAPLGRPLPNRRHYPGFWKSFQETLNMTGLNIGRPLYGDMVRQWVIPLRYAVRDRQGRVLYVLGVNILMANQQAIWRNLSLANKSALGIMRHDGYLQSRWPSVGNLHALYGTPKHGVMAKVLAANPHAKTGQYEGQLDFSNKERRFGAYCRLSQYPMVAFVSLPVTELWVTWWSRIQVPFALLLLFFVASFIVHGYAIRLQNAIDQERKKSRKALFEAQEYAEVTLHAIGDAVISTDSNARITYLNPEAEHLTGYSKQAALGLPVEQVFRLWDDADDSPLENPVHLILRGDALPKRERHSVLLTQAGKRIPIEENASLIFDHDRQIIGAVLIFKDVTEARAMAQEITWQARHDGMTGLPNRRAFEQRLAHALEAVRQNAGMHAVMFMDLDQFKFVNDTCGHAGGDELLQQVARAFQRVIRSSDFLARLGGDEFALLLEDCPVENACEVAHKLLKTVEDFRFFWDGKAFPIGVSIGITALNADTASLGSVLQAADTACYLAKKQGRNRICVYEAENHAVVDHQQEIAWVTQVTHALEENRLCLYRQHILPLREGLAPRYEEILLRMVDADGSLMNPGAFIPTLERYGMMGNIDRWVIRNVCEHMQAQMESYGVAGLGHYAINLSCVSLNEEDFLDFVLGQLDQHAIPPGFLSFEITETAAIANLTRVQGFIDALRQRGCHFALDDFGSGLSSFAYLKNLSVDTLKIDGAFVKDIATDRFDRAMVETVTRIAHDLGLNAVAEFVENTEILAILRTIGIDFAQGYAIHRPEPLVLEDARHAFSAARHELTLQTGHQAPS